MFRRSYRILLPVVIFLFALSAHAQIIGGHERQRLILQLTESLQRHYEQNPLKLYLPELPVEVAADSPEQRALYSLLLTLAEEGLLVERKKASEQALQSGRNLIAAVSEFSVPVNSTVPEVVYGTVVIDEVVSLQTLKQLSSGTARYRIEFLWHLVSPAEWLWGATVECNP